MDAKEQDPSNSENIIEETRLEDKDLDGDDVTEITESVEKLENLEDTSEENDREALMEELLEARAKADENLDGWQRSLAEFANYKKRIERDQLQMHQNIAGALIKRYLEVVDDLERSLKNKPEMDGDATWAAGIELIYQKMLNILESEGVTPMDVEGILFDPNLHEAVTSEDSEQHESGQIIEVLQTGYMIGDRVLRPAMVRVAK